MLEEAAITLHQNLQGLFLFRTTGAQAPSAACPEQSRCEALGAEQPQEQLLLKYHRVFHTKAAHSWLWFLKVCGEVPHFSLAPAGRQPLAPSAGEQLKVCMPWVPGQLSPASCWLYLQTIRKAQNHHLHAKASALPWHIPFFKDPFNSFHDGPHFCHGSWACRARAKAHGEIQGGGNLKKVCGAKFPVSPPFSRVYFNAKLCDFRIFLK